MGFLRSMLGSKTAGMMACYDISKPMAKESCLCAQSLTKYRENIAQGDKNMAGAHIAMLYCFFLMHYFNRQFFELYGSDRLSKVQAKLFPCILFSFKEQFSEAVVTDDDFMDKFNRIELKLGQCCGILATDGKVKFNDPDSALSVFSNKLCTAVFKENSNPMMIAEVAVSALDGIARLNLPPKLQELGKWF